MFFLQSKSTAQSISSYTQTQAHTHTNLLQVCGLSCNKSEEKIVWLQSAYIFSNSQGGREGASPEIDETT